MEEMAMSEVDEVVSAWNRIVRWLEVNAPASVQALRPPATDADIDRLNEYLGFEIPDVLEAWLRVNNGSTAKDSKRPIPGGGTALIAHVDSVIFPDGKVFHGCEEIMRQHAEYLHMARDMGDEDYWKPSWIPIVEKSDAPYGFILDAEQREGISPILSFSESSYPTPYASSLSGLLTPVAEVLEHGEATATDGRVNWGS